MYKSIYLKRGKEESLKRFHPWVFSGAIAAIDDGVEEGELVRVISSNGEFIAVGMYQIGSIAVRVLTFKDTVIDHGFNLYCRQSPQQHLSIGSWRGRQHSWLGD